MARLRLHHESTEDLGLGGKAAISRAARPHVPNLELTSSAHLGLRPRGHFVKSAAPSGVRIRFLRAFGATVLRRISAEVLGDEVGGESYENADH